MALETTPPEERGYAHPDLLATTDWLADHLDDPKVRQPDITLAKKLLGWEPQVNPETGLRRTVEWFREN